MTTQNTASLNAVQLPQSPISCSNFIGGKWVAATGPQFDIISPYSGRVIGRVGHSTAGDIDEAVRSATTAAKVWGRTPIKERCAVMFRFRQNLLRDIELLSHRISAESGKTLAEARAGVMKGIEVTEFATSLQNIESGGKMEVSRGVTCEYRREPLGVVAGITPFNFPAMVPLWMIPIAITLGNAFIWKPSDKTPLTSILIAELMKEAGLPDGLLTVIQGGRETVEAILDHPGISSIGFVGSTPVARQVYTRGSAHGKRVLALGGAKNHIILMPDADPDLAARGIADSFTGCAGQRCMAASVLLAVGDCEALIKEITAKASAIRLGEEMGALISQESRDRIRSAIDAAQENGATVRLDGRTPQLGQEWSAGHWLAPTILDQVKPGTQAAVEELFGPVLSIVRVKTLSEALAIQSTSPFGNAASVFTRDGGVAERVCRESKAGMVGVNIGVPVPREPFSFGGVAESKFGQGDITGPSSLDLWTDLKKVTTKWSVASDQNWMS
jgi:malonate-semialdehyde dehydrogenase (acetylating)/methylmalonate-semialdehyde dehydrogenase